MLIVFGFVYFAAANAYPATVAVNPCGIVNSKENFRDRRAVKQLITRVSVILPSLDIEFPESFEDFALTLDGWLPDDNWILDDSEKFSKKLIKINEGLKVFSCALDIITKAFDGKDTSECQISATNIEVFIENHRNLVCLTDAVIGFLGLQNSDAYPSKNVNIPRIFAEDFIIDDCTSKSEVLFSVYRKYTAFLSSFGKLLIRNYRLNSNLRG